MKLIMSRANLSRSVINQGAGAVERRSFLKARDLLAEKPLNMGGGRAGGGQSAGKEPAGACDLPATVFFFCVNSK